MEPIMVDAKSNEKLSVSEGNSEEMPAVECDQVLEYPTEKLAHNNNSTKLHRTFKARHIQMIGLGGCIGSGIFLSTGKALYYGNWTAMFIAWIVVCTMSTATMQVMSEACVIFPTSGAFIDHAARFVDPALGFAVGFCEWLGWTTTMAAEGAVFRTILSFWTEEVPTAACMTIYLVVIFSIHLLPNRVFAEFEFVTAAIKVVMMVIIIIVCIAILCGAGPTGSTNWGVNFTELPAFPNGFKGVAQAFLLASWSAGGLEFIGISNGEAKMPRWNLPRAVTNLVIRIFIFYMSSITFITLLVPYNDPRLFGAFSGEISASPFVIAMQDAGIKGLPSMINAITMLGLCAIGSEGVYLASRMSTAMARMGLFPQILGRVDKQGRPYVSICASAVLAITFTYINIANTGAVIFTWFSAISSTMSFITYIVICITNWRMRKAFKLQNDNPLALQYAYKNKFYPMSSVFLFVTSIFILCSTFYVSLFPIGKPTTAANFFETFICVPLFVVLYIGYKIIYKTKIVDLRTVDIQRGRRPLSAEDIAFLDAYYAKPWYKRALTYITF
ncbi:AAT family amino acid transporter-2 [Coleophoma cylindrospora]|uniref:AAT family amino acid transporter-2 n=1 Tax=Coleophoma cylindrospora TaxID=1849047 RepID=A0A3D8QPN7_9HELO|nr:AAT family amino acid transporter-2 [Coleophoma cylindrospora]